MDKPKSFRLTWGNAAFGFMAVALFVLPMARLVWLSLSTEQGGLSLAQYYTLLGDTRAAAAIWNTIYISILASCISAIGGIATAFLVAYTNIRYKNLIEILVLLPFVIPAYVVTLSWTGLTAQGSLLTMLLLKLGLPPINLYSVTGIILMLGICHISVVHVTVSHMLRKVPVEAGWAARASGCPLWRSLLKIDLPMVMPAVAGGTVLAFLADVDNFAVPAFLGISSNIPVLSTYIYEKVISFGPDSFAYGAVLSVVLSIIALVGAVVSTLLVHKQKALDSVKSTDEVRIELSPGLRRLVELGTVALLLLFSIVPSVYMAISAMLKGYVFSLSPQDLTWDNYLFVITNEGISEAAANSVFMALVASLICLGLGSLIAYMSVRQNSSMANFVKQCASMTYSVPGIVLALALIFYWSQPIPGVSTGLYGTYTIMILGYVTRYMILQINNSSAAFMTIAEDSEQAALISGSTRLRMWRKIIIPQLLVPALAGTFFIFLSALTELTMSSVMASASTKTIGLAIFNLQQAGDYSLAAAVSSVIFVFVAAVYTLQKLFKIWHHRRKAQ